MKTLLLLRHAKSSWKHEGLDDHDRPLNGRGKRDAPRIGHLVSEIDLVPDLILSSTARRTRKTAEKVAAACEYEGEIRLVEDLYQAAPEDLRATLAAHGGGADRIMLVGHNPGLEEFLEELVGDFERLPTAALALIDCAIDDWRELGRTDVAATLVKLWRPRELTA